MKAKTVGVDELKDAILAMIVDRFGDRQLDIDTADRALRLANFELKRKAQRKRKS
jgi:hypothetical protein